MKIAIIADKKTGHLSQCLGLREVIKKYNKKKDIFVLNKDLIALPGFLERSLTLLNEKLYLFLLKLLNPNLVDYKYDLVICSGSRTAIPAYLFAKLTEAKVIYIGSPKFRIMKKFDGIVSTKTDISSVYKVIATELPPTKFKPYLTKKEPTKQSLVLIGGDGSGYDYGESDWYRLAFEFQNINTTFINSRRTPKFAWQNLKDNSGKSHVHLDEENTDFASLETALDEHSHIFVTADSTSMISEIVTRGYFVNVIEMRGPITKEHHHEIVESLQDKGLLRILRLNQLHLSENKFQENVKEFVVTERDALKSRILKLL
tara:strand:+ start:558 stop:1505 length:948 start_codon:yes stop_codon:yes gene_type:complete